MAKALIWLYFSLIGQINSKSHCKASYLDNQLVTNKGTIKYEVPVNTNKLAKDMEEIDRQLKKNTTEFSFDATFTKQNELYKIYIPKEGKDLTRSRSTCLEEDLESALIEDILEAGLQNIFRRLISVSYIQKRKNEIQLKCNINRFQNENNCLEQLKSLRKFNITVDIKQILSRMENETLGILTIEQNSLSINKGNNLKLPCVGKKEDKITTKWEIIKNRFLYPKFRLLKSSYDSLTRQLVSSQIRRKRSLIGTVFGLASASETSALRAALKTELDNQKQVSRGMENLLRNQIKEAETINSGTKELYRLRTEEENLKSNIVDLTKYLEESFDKTTTDTHRLEKTIVSLLHRLTINSKIENLSTKVETLLDILHCPHGKCTKILEDISARHNIGNTRTITLMAELLTVEITENKII